MTWAERIKNRASFLQTWGPDYTSMEIVSFWMQASHDGKHVGLLYHTADGMEHRVSIPLSFLGDFAAHLSLAFDNIALIAAATEPNKPTQ